MQLKLITCRALKCREKESEQRQFHRGYIMFVYGDICAKIKLLILGTYRDISVAIDIF